jgi:hypothetical protein
MKNQYCIAIIVVALIIKFFLLAFQSFAAPESKFQPDSYLYMGTEAALFSHSTPGIVDPLASFRNGSRSSPGYPLFLAVFHGFMRIPLEGILFIQVLLTILAAFIVYKAAIQIDPRMGFVSAAIILYSQAIAIYSLMILTESLFLVLIALFMYYFIQYLKNREIRPLLISSVMLVLAIYVRPGSYAIGVTVAVFIIYANAHANIKKSIVHAIIFLVTVYALLGIWQIRKYMTLGDWAFSGVDQTSTGNELLHSYAKSAKLHTPGMTPVQYYLFGIWSCFFSLMARPGSLKYFHVHVLTAMGKVFGYLWVAFSGIGLIYGIRKIGKNIYCHFLLFIVINYVCGSIIGEMWNVGERYRIQMEPFLAVLSAYGWILLISLIEKRSCIKATGAKI